MKTLVVVQARLGSSRLPGKVMLPLAGEPLLIRLVERIRAARSHFDLVVATTTEPDDHEIVELCDAHQVPSFCGHPTDLLDRHYQAALAAAAEVVVKIPSDCPLIDPRVVDRVLEAWRRARTPWDYLSNLHPASYPDGNDVEVMRMEALEKAWREATRSFEREHTTPFLWERPERFRIGNVDWETGLDLSMRERFTVDYPEDYAFVSAVYEALWRPNRRPFGLWDVLRLLEERPQLRRLNERYLGVNWYRHHLAELKTVSPRETRKPEVTR